MPKKHDSFIGTDGMRYVWVSDDFGYIREPLDDAKARLYYETHILKKNMLEKIKSSNLDAHAKAFCTFSVNVTYLEQLINEFYDAATVICTRNNPMIYKRKPTSEEVAIWADRDGNAKAFAKLSLGQKHQVLQIYQFITSEDIIMYKRLLTKLAKLVVKRNQIIHGYFNSLDATDIKVVLVTDANKLCNQISDIIDKLNGLFSWYILKHTADYL